ncbi:TetR/AcrR family transcriptional regulator [Streptomyces amakusaensis]|uniref:TetR/AcrR family transcriptional regulator n=1 Tax=Streptomyces amakusaensis TaxID=67271 RepID=A0ABW0ANM4_9ACTN
MTEGNDRMDPARALALLWREGREPARPARGPRQGLTVDRIVRTAIAIADAEGLAALSMRKVAKPLGVSAMSLYTYVPRRAELVNCMLDEVLGEAPSLESAGDWRQALELYARSSMDIARHHPWVPPLVSSRMLMGPHETAMWDGVLGALSGVGLDEREMLSVVHLLNGYVRGAAQQSADAEQDARRSGLSYDQWYEQTGPLLERRITAARFPALTRIWKSGVFEEPGEGLGPDSGFEFGLQRILDGIEQRIADRAAGRADR